MLGISALYDFFKKSWAYLVFQLLVQRDKAAHNDGALYFFLDYYNLNSGLSLTL